ncbi:sensor histidine kinase [Dyadobacter subterraneus]|uniref:Histidine kinase n=1 Tax=Dyadobacter subterraneus TaxID=2773304 RepID=A0ABR9WCX3_9BACT|nr:histidine kinase [Dyadobacter subterraneus]MBE9463332.1 histidine kinase [Dyadobacter subterraneus]
MITTENTSNQNWFFKYKLYHIPFWCAYQYLWWVIAIGNPVKAAASILFTAMSVKFLFYVVFQVIAICFNLYYLIPKFLEKSRFTEYVIYLTLTILAASLLIVPGYYLAAFFAGKTLVDMYGPDGGCLYFLSTTSFPSTLASMTLAMSIKLTKNWIQTERRQRELEKEKLETELKFLKNQFNPHFLFNTINSIFFLIHKNADMASDALAKFSELLRYQLYECNDIQIPLSKEIAYMKNFIELEKLRQNDNVEIDFQMNAADTGHLGIAPFVLMVFVENAFKHVSKNSGKTNWIKIHLELKQAELNFSVSNSTSPQLTTDLIHYGGIGLKNVKRRLDLIYPEDYQLEIQNRDSDFEVKLSLKLSELVVRNFEEIAA